ncbi:TetR/AcrR family transcriptional regulator [uncultured Acetobacterium sp.]|uniref:TetR/AcrR family transcriptional regulator n=1 Tax=uncultured Acetobacterium sp. TaxID=217139 RepID=UPI0025DDAE46|nr:TetR/AcrR family transcriptional regulator [uncultured Acetobacterium sp.]
MVINIDNAMIKRGNQLKDNKETKEKLLVSAKKEFIEKGYLSASLRNICKNAGVTTGALYFFFEDKEDLYGALVAEPIKKLHAVMDRHYAEEQAQIDAGLLIENDMDHDVEAAIEIVRCLYLHRDEFMMLLTKSQGSRYQEITGGFVMITEKHFRRMADNLEKSFGAEPVADYLIHWIAHMLIDAFIHILTHEVSEEAAEVHVQQVIKYMIGGWVGLFTPANK